MMSKDKDGSDRSQTAERLSLEFDIPTHDEWREEVERLLRGAPFEKRMLTSTHEGITLQPLYRQADVETLEGVPGMPGFAPLVRGSRAIRPHGRAWGVAQTVSDPNPLTCNEMLRVELNRGLNEINIRLDSSVRHDDDGGPVKDGILVQTASDLATVLKDTNWSGLPLTIHCGSSGLACAAMLGVLAEHDSVSLDTINGAVAFDPLGALAENGALPGGESVFDELAALTNWAQKNVPSLATIWVHGEPYHDGGGTAVDELAMMIATGIEYLRMLDNRGIDPEVAAPRIRFSAALGTNFFMEVAKLRAARLLWNTVLDESGVQDKERHMYMHAATSHFSQTLYDPHVNMLRAATQTLSGAVGGVDSLDVAAFDEAAGRPSRFSRRIARNTQLIIHDEAHLSQVLDPAGGSWYVEKLTAEVAEKAWEIVQKIEAAGGMTAALTAGLPQEMVADSLQKKMDAVAARRDVLVGTTHYPNPADKVTPQSPDTPSGRRHKSAAPDEASGSTEKLKSASIPDMVSQAIEAARSGASVQQINAALPTRSGGETISAAAIRPHRQGEQIESLRLAVEKQHADQGKLKVFLATLGPVRAYMPRLDFAASFFEVGGYDVVRTQGYDSPDAAVAAAVESGSSVVVLCGLDETYTDQALRVTEQLREHSKEIILVLAGWPNDESFRTSLQSAGLDMFVHVKSNILKVLSDIAMRLGVQL